MEELRVPTRRVAVELFMADGVHTRGVMYLTPTRHDAGSPEEIAELLNDDRVFVPFRADDPTIEVWIVNKQHLMRVHLEDCDTLRPDPASAEPAPICTIVLCDRSRLTGQLLFDAPLSMSRLVDKFNGAPSFMTFVTDDGVDFVHRSHVTQVFQHS